MRSEAEKVELTGHGDNYNTDSVDLEAKNEVDNQKQDTALVTADDKKTKNNVQVGSPISFGKQIESQPATFNPLKVLGSPDDYLEPLIEDGDSDDGRSSSDEIRETAEQALLTYNSRLAKIGHSAFQVRLNIFFTFVVHDSVKIDDYD